jgi:hypothetical protein
MSVYSTAAGQCCRRTCTGRLRHRVLGRTCSAGMQGAPSRAPGGVVVWLLSVCLFARPNRYTAYELAGPFPPVVIGLAPCRRASCRCKSGWHCSCRAVPWYEVKQCIPCEWGGRGHAIAAVGVSTGWCSCALQLCGAVSLAARWQQLGPTHPMGLRLCYTPHVDQMVQCTGVFLLVSRGCTVSCRSLPHACLLTLQVRTCCTCLGTDAANKDVVSLACMLSWCGCRWCCTGLCAIPSTVCAAGAPTTASLRVSSTFTCCCSIVAGAAMLICSAMQMGHWRCFFSRYIRWQMAAPSRQACGSIFRQRCSA